MVWIVAAIVAVVLFFLFLPWTGLWGPVFDDEDDETESEDDKKDE